MAHRALNRLLLLACVLSLLVQVLRAQAQDLDDVTIPPAVVESYENINLSAAQQVEFDAAMLNCLEQVKSMISRERLKRRVDIERRIARKTRRVFQGCESPVLATLDEGQLDEYQLYKEKTLAVLHSRTGRDYFYRIDDRPTRSNQN